MNFYNRNTAMNGIYSSNVRNGYLSPKYRAY